MAFSLSDAFSAFQPEAPNVPDGSGIADALARNAQLGQIRSVIGEAMQQAAPVQIAQQQPQRRGGLGSILGRIGDALSVANGGEAVYANKLRNREMGGAVANYLGNTDAILASIFQQDPQAGLALYKMKHPEAAQAPDIIREMTAAGIDPASDEGKAIIRGHLTKDGAADPAGIREYEYAKGQGFTGSYLDFLNAKGGPLIANNGDGTFTIVPRAMVGGGRAAPGGPAPGTVEDGYRFKGGDPSKQENWEPVQGGATASTPSPTFPDR